MKKILVLLLVLSVAGMASATFDWRGPAYPGTSSTDQSWFTAANWNSGVPTISATPTGVRTYGSNHYATSLTSCPVIANGDARAMEVRVGGSAPTDAGMSYLVMNSGTLKTMNFLMIGPDSPTNGGRAGTVYMHGGVMTLGGATADGLDNGSRTSGHLYVGHGQDGGTINPIGKLFMDGGTIDAGGDFAIGKNYGRGSVYLSGDALIKANTLKMNPLGTGSASLDISGNAQVVINGNITQSIAGANNDLLDWIASSWITANGGDGTVYYNFNSTTNKTTISAVPEPATVCLLGLGALSLIRRKK
jgi:hypothetical protein